MSNQFISRKYKTVKPNNFQTLKKIAEEILTESDNSIKDLYREEILDLKNEIKSIESDLWDEFSDFTPRGIEQKVSLTVFQVKAGGGLESAISVQHLAQFYDDYIEWNGKKILKKI